MVRDRIEIHDPPTEHAVLGNHEQSRRIHVHDEREDRWNHCIDVCMLPCRSDTVMAIDHYEVGFCVQAMVMAR